MPESRVVETTYDGKGNMVEQKTAIISDEQLAIEAEEADLMKGINLIDEINSVKEIRILLKRLCTRLIRKRLLP